MAVTRLVETPRLLMPATARATHIHVIGQPGTGKSRALESWIMQDIASGQGVGVIDPHGELFDHLVSRIALLTEDRPELPERIVIINPLDRRYIVGFNPLEPIQGISTERLAGFMTDVLVKIWKIDVADAPRMIRLLTYTFLALADLGLGLVEVPRFLLDSDWREALITNAKHPDVQAYFHFEFPKTEGAIHQWVTPVLNKIGPLIFDTDLRMTFSMRSTVQFWDILDKGLVLLVNLSKGQMGEGNSALFGAFIVAHIQKAALARQGAGQRRPFYLYLDEFQHYTTDNIKDILSESRKYALSLIIAHQYLAQLSGDLLGAVLNTVGTTVCFRVGHQDASVLSRELFPYGSMEHTQRYWQSVRVGRISIPFPSEVSWPMTHDELASILTQLAQREFVCKCRGRFPPIKERTIDIPVPVMTDQLFQARERLLRTSAERYGRLKREVSQNYDRLQYLALKPGAIITDYEET